MSFCFPNMSDQRKTLSTRLSTENIELSALTQACADGICHPDDSQPPFQFARGHENVTETPLHDVNMVHEADDEIYNKFSPRHKIIITISLSLCGFLSSIASTVVLSAVPEVADFYSTTGDLIGISNALYLLFMGLSPCFCGPIAQVYGRRWVCGVVGGITALLTEF